MDRHALAAPPVSPPPPRRPLAWLPHLWSHVLFPGREVDRRPAPRAALLLLGRRDFGQLTEASSATRAFTSKNERSFCVL